ncbi:3'-5' exonuclease [Corynebacterium sp. S7]
MLDKFRRKDRGELEEGRFLAVDVETTGLKSKRDQLVSIGWVPVTDRVIDLSGAGYFVLAGASVGDSALVHGVTDDDIANHGVAPEIVLEEFEKALESRGLLAHFAQMETGFISELHRQVRGKPWKFREDQVTDTFALERRHMERMATYPRGEDLRLARVRERYGLPNYRNHNALTDALACAEVYLAITA